MWNWMQPKYLWRMNGRIRREEERRHLTIRKMKKKKIPLLRISGLTLSALPHANVSNNFLLVVVAGPIGSNVSAVVVVSIQDVKSTIFQGLGRR
tara:strand:- start:257 stop:538 length:282 start_codon:yes stop_codon:yes gene_type:complete